MLELDDNFLDHLILVNTHINDFIIYMCIQFRRSDK